MKLLILIFIIWVEGGKINTQHFDSIFATIFTTSTEQPLQTILMARNPNFDPLPIMETDDESETCECVRYYLCHKNGTVNTSGFDIVEARYTFNLSERTRRCPNIGEKCCKKDDMKTVPVIPLPSQSKGCGVRNKNGISFHIVGNKHNESQFGEFPWMLGILHKITVKETGEELLAYKCGGSLIHPQVALTSAHCVYSENISKFKVRAGEWDTKIINEIHPYQDRNLSEIIIHPDFNRLNLEYDVALLVFDTPLDIFEHVDTICLPSQYEIFENSRCFASGWGKDRFQDNGKYQTIMKKLDLPIVPRAECQQLLSTTVLGNNFFLGDTFICAGGELRQDTCTGDGGSPLVCPIPGKTNRYYQRGVVSWGVECGKIEIPAVYSNIAAFRNWIDMRMWKLNFDTSTYTAH